LSDEELSVTRTEHLHKKKYDAALGLLATRRRLGRRGDFFAMRSAFVDVDVFKKKSKKKKKKMGW